MILFLTIPLGIFIIIKTYIEIKKGKASQQWNTTEGIVTHAGIMGLKSSNQGASSTSQHAYFQYEYNVGGEKILGARIFYGDFLLTMLQIRKPAMQAVLEYTPGQTVTVHYLPSKPAESVLQTGARQVVYWGYAIGIGIIIAGFVYAFIAGAQQAELYSASLLLC
jgi:hypothetical protein